VDTVVGGTALAGAGTLGALLLTDQTGGAASIGYLIGLTPIALLFSTSAVYGYLSRSHCERAKQLQQPARD
jgi:hypothetical protein